MTTLRFDQRTRIDYSNLNSNLFNALHDRGAVWDSKISSIYNIENDGCNQSNTSTSNIMSIAQSLG